MRRDRHGVSVRDEFRLVVGEVLEDQGREVTIFSEREQVLLVERVEDPLMATKTLIRTSGERRNKQGTDARQSSRR